ncbi:MAG: SinI family restriction endonuclease, partial [Alistipes onderdonkii]
HSLLMTIENNIGELLEEYLAVKLSPLGWYCCWGSTIDAVDFCKADGSLLQIKTSDNSENSSSSRVRQGTPIEKWFRRFSRRPGVYNWESLNGYWDGLDRVVSFRAFAEKTAAANRPAYI